MTTATKNAQSDSSDTIGPQIAGYGYSYAVTSLLSALLVVLKEENASVLNFMVSLSGHHWVTHGLLDIIVFVLLGGAFSRATWAKNASAGTVISAVIGSTIVSGLIIAAFYGL